MSKLNIFSRLDKFTGLGPGTDLRTWLTNFERCCTIAEKTDDLVQGQLLMLSAEGRTLAILERLEEQKSDETQ